MPVKCELIPNLNLPLQVTRYEESISQLHKEVDKVGHQYRQIQSQLVDREQQVADQKVQLTTVQGNQKEAMDQLTEKSRQVATLKTDLDRTNQQNHAMAEEVRKIKKISDIFAWDIIIPVRAFKEIMHIYNLILDCHV